MSDIAISIQNLNKEYRLGVIGTGTITRDLNRWWAQVRGKPDPNLLIGIENKLSEAGGEYVYALRNINLEVKQGEIVGVIGKNGAGKSTLLKILSRVTTPTTGSIEMYGRVASLLEVGTGFHPELTGRENVFLNGAIMGMSKAEIRSKFDEIVDFAGIGKYIDTPVKRYSSGMYVRLGFAVAAYLEPEILVVDEVLAVGDAEFQKKAIGKMQDVSKKEGRTVLFVSHNMASVQTLCTSGVLLKEGTIASIGNISDVVRLYLTENNSKKLLPEKELEQVADKAFQLTHVKICDEGGHVRHDYECDEDVFLIMKFKIKEKIPGLYAYLQISKSDYDIAVLVSDSNDVIMNFFDSLPLGEVDLKVKIPKRSIGVGEYTVYLNFTSRYNVASFDVDSPRNVVSFSLSDNKTQRGNKRGGYLSTLLKWELIS